MQQVKRSNDDKGWMLMMPMIKNGSGEEKTRRVSKNNEEGGCSELLVKVDIEKCKLSAS